MLFQHLVIVSLHSDVSLEVVEDAFSKRKKWQSEMAKSKIIDIRMLQRRRPSLSVLKPQTLFKYPPG